MQRKFLQISSGQGPGECRLFVTLLAGFLRREALSGGLECHLPDEPDKHGNASLLLRIRGETAEAFVRRRIGTMQWIQPSPLRPHHPRKNRSEGITEGEFDPENGHLCRTNSARTPGGPPDTADSISTKPIPPSGSPIRPPAKARKHRTNVPGTATGKPPVSACSGNSGNATGNASPTGRQARRQNHYPLIRGSPLRIFKGDPLKEVFPSLSPSPPRTGKERAFRFLRFGADLQAYFLRNHLHSSRFFQKRFFEKQTCKIRIRRYIKIRIRNIERRRQCDPGSKK